MNGQPTVYLNGPLVGPDWIVRDPHFAKLDARRDHLVELFGAITLHDYRFLLGRIILGLHTLARMRRALQRSLCSEDRKQELTQTAEAAERLSELLGRDRSWTWQLEIMCHGKEYGEDELPEFRRKLDRIAEQARYLREHPGEINMVLWGKPAGRDLDYVRWLWPYLFAIWQESRRHPRRRMVGAGKAERCPPLEEFVRLVHQAADLPDFSSSTLKAAARRRRRGSIQPPDFLCD